MDHLTAVWRTYWPLLSALCVGVLALLSGLQKVLAFVKDCREFFQRKKAPDSPASTLIHRPTDEEVFKYGGKISVFSRQIVTRGVITLSLVLVFCGIQLMQPSGGGGRPSDFSEERNRLRRDLASSQSETQARAKEADEAQTQVSSLRTRVASLEGEHKDLAELRTVVASSKQQAEQANARASQLERDSADLRAKVADANRTAAEFKTAADAQKHRADEYEIMLRRMPNVHLPSDKVSP